MPTVMNAPLLDAFWTALKTRLDTATMQGILGGAGRIHVAGVEEIPPREGPENADWGRVVVVPSDALWPRIEVAYEPQHFALLLRAEFNDWKASGYSASRGLGLAQQEAYTLLDAWLPTGVSGVLFVLPLTRRSAPQVAPLRDEDRGLLVTSSQYRAEIVGAS